MSESSKIKSKAGEILGEFFKVSAWVGLVGIILIIFAVPVVDSEQRQLKFLNTKDESRLTPFVAQLCRSREICENYRNIRDECAIAGSIRDCISIKMGKDDYSMCDENGSVMGVYKEVLPSPTQCFLSDFREFKNRMEKGIEKGSYTTAMLD